eukprot:Platyproteum_vivax@DN5663_c0_g1_i2.p1
MSMGSELLGAKTREQELDETIALLETQIARLHNIEAPSKKKAQLEKKIEVVSQNVEMAKKRQNKILLSNQKSRNEIEGLRRERIVFDRVRTVLLTELKEKEDTKGSSWQEDEGPHATKWEDIGTYVQSKRAAKKVASSASRCVDHSAPQRKYTLEALVHEEEVCTHEQPYGFYSCWWQGEDEVTSVFLEQLGDPSVQVQEMYKKQEARATLLLDWQKRVDGQRLVLEDLQRGVRRVLHTFQPQIEGLGLGKNGQTDPEANSADLLEEIGTVELLMQGHLATAPKKVVAVPLQRLGDTNHCSIPTVLLPSSSGPTGSATDTDSDDDQTVWTRS